MAEQLFVGGHCIPGNLVALVEAGRWVPPEADQIYLDVFGQLADQPCFYDLAQILRENAHWQQHSVDDEFGEPVEGCSLGLDPQRSIVIADLGMDRPIVLDYRESESNPRVLYRTFANPPNWVQVASKIDDLIHFLGLR